MQDPCAVFLRTVKLRCIFAALPPFADAETSQTQDGAETRAPAESPRVASATGAQTGATTSRKRGRVQTGGRRARAAALGKMPSGGAQMGATARNNRGGTQLVERRGLAVAACGKMTPHHESQPRRGAGDGALAPDRCRAAERRLRNIPSKCGAAALLRACP